MIERIWILLAAVLVIVAAAFLWRNNISAAFVTAALGAVSWFLSYRAQIQAKLSADEAAVAENETNEEAHEN